MNSLGFLMWREAKNSFKEMLRKPGKLILYLCFVAIILLAVYGSFAGGQTSRTPLQRDVLAGIYFALLTLFLGFAVQRGFASGAAIFDMADVNFLFVSPLNPRTIMVYGLMKTAKTSFWASIFVLFQVGTLSRLGVTIGGVMILFLVFVLCMVANSILSLFVYSFLNADPCRKRTVMVVGVLCFVPLLVFLAVKLLSGMEPMGALQRAIESPFLAAIPIGGWATAGAMGLMQGHLLAGILWIGLLVFACAGMLAYVLLSKVDYYEDVLVASETAFERKRAAEEGNVQAAATGKVTVHKTGIRGAGASAFFYKHLREDFRQNRLGFIGFSTLITFAAVLAFSLWMKEELNMTALVAFLMWMQVFMIGTGRGLKELYAPYLYMVPEPPLQKMIWSNMETFFKTLLESILYVGIPGLIMKGHPLLILSGMLLYTAFSFALVGINYLSLRWTQTSVSQGILLMIYFVVTGLAMIPGILAAVWLGTMVGGVWGNALGFATMTIWELLVGLVCFGLSKGMLHHCDMPVMQVRKS